MTPSERTMPAITATWHAIRKAWLVALPGGIVMPASDEGAVQILVSKHAPGSAIRWLR